MEAATDAAPAGALQNIVATQCRQTTFRPLQFFVTWNGVLCVVYRGFPPSIASLKRLLPLACNLSQENPGSLWPKTSIAALNDDMTLTESELTLLISICQAASGKLHLCPPVMVKQLAYIHYMCRCLSTALLRCSIPLTAAPQRAVARPSTGFTMTQPQLDIASTSATTATVVEAPAAVAEEEPEDAELQATLRVVRAAHEPSYWKDVARPGHRISHYTELAHGSTLAHLLAESETHRAENAALLECIKDFKASVHEHFPGRYTFFGEDSLHITIRALS